MTINDPHPFDVVKPILYQFNKNEKFETVVISLH